MQSGPQQARPIPGLRLGQETFWHAYPGTARSSPLAALTVDIKPTTTTLLRLLTQLATHDMTDT
jgi:hypothetical protein